MNAERKTYHVQLLVHVSFPLSPVPRCFSSQRCLWLLSVEFLSAALSFTPWVAFSRSFKLHQSPLPVCTFADSNFRVQPCHCASFHRGPLSFKIAVNVPPPSQACARARYAQSVALFLSAPLSWLCSASVLSRALLPLVAMAQTVCFFPIACAQFLPAPQTHFRFAFHGALFPLTHRPPVSPSRAVSPKSQTLKTLVFRASSLAVNFDSLHGDLQSSSCSAFLFPRRSRPSSAAKNCLLPCPSASLPVLLR
ncbi:hypothetical protein TRVL_02653 [Trypanosoma vivax]|nr:hypothetical protein TRVL_02653 [Trypanosoma vivax]